MTCQVILRWISLSGTPNDRSDWIGLPRWRKKISSGSCSEWWTSWKLRSIPAGSVRMRLDRQIFAYASWAFCCSLRAFSNFASLIITAFPLLVLRVVFSYFFSSPFVSSFPVDADTASFFSFSFLAAASAASCLLRAVCIFRKWASASRPRGAHC